MRSHVPWHSLVVLMLCVPASKTNAASCTQIPNLEMQNVRGGKVVLNAWLGHPVLLGFLDALAPAGQKTGNPSRSQLVVHKSLAAQYASKGLKIAVIDASSWRTKQTPTQSALINASYDWNLNFPLLQDDQKLATRAFKITTIPTTLLISAKGCVADRWNGLALAQTIAAPIQKMLSR
jgi:AhpC/TSA family